MNIEIDSRPSYGMAVVTLDRGERITAESGAMVAMSKQLTVDTTFNGVGKGGALDWLQAAFTGLVRRFLAGETLFVNHFTAKADGQEVMLAPTLVGDVEHLHLDGQRRITVQSSSYLASTKGISVDLIWGGFSMLFSGEGAFFLRCRGEGDVLINAYGAIDKVEIDGKYRVDSGHVVAFEGDLKYAIRRAGGLKSTFFSGEGLVLEFTGTGTVWVQTRNLSTLLGWIIPSSFREAGMRFDIQHGPAYALAIVHIDPGDTIVAEGGAMVSMSSNVKMETSAGKKNEGMLGGLMKGLKRMVAGESFFQNRFTAEGTEGHVTFAPTPQGDIVTYDLAPELDLYLQSTAFLCSDDTVETTAKWGGAKTFFGGEGLVMLKATGAGPIAFNSFGGVRCIDVDGDYTVDTGHIVAFESSLNFKVRRFGGGWKAFIFGGEGLVCEFTGTGKMWIQTRNMNEFGKLLGQKLPREADMRHEIKHKPDYASLHVLLDEGESLVTEAGAMMGMDPALKMSTNMKGGLLGAAKRALGGESVFLNTYTGTGAAQRLDVAPSSPGDMIHLAMDGNKSVMVQRGSYCASTTGIEVSAKWGGAKAFFGGEGLIMLKCTGQGDLFLASYGAIHEVDIEGSYTVDTGHIVAFEDTVTFSVTKSGGLKSLFLSKEGLVCRFEGTGKVSIQTRNAPALAGFLHPFRRVKAKK